MLGKGHLYLWQKGPENPVLQIFGLFLCLIIFLRFSFKFSFLDFSSLFPQLQTTHLDASNTSFSESQQALILFPNLISCLSLFCKSCPPFIVNSVRVYRYFRIFLPYQETRLCNSHGTVMAQEIWSWLFKKLWDMSKCQQKGGLILQTTWVDGIWLGEHIFSGEKLPSKYSFSCPESLPLRMY